MQLIVIYDSLHDALRQMRFFDALPHRWDLFFKFGGDSVTRCSLGEKKHSARRFIRVERFYWLDELAISSREEIGVGEGDLADLLLLEVRVFVGGESVIEVSLEDDLHDIVFECSALGFDLTEVLVVGVLLIGALEFVQVGESEVDVVEILGGLLVLELVLAFLDVGPADFLRLEKVLQDSAVDLGELEIAAEGSDEREILALDLGD